jgi:hypothetical protein
LSRHRKIQFSRSKAVLVAAGALSVATAASATGVTLTSGASAHTGPPTGRATAASTVPRLAVTDQLVRPPGAVAYQLTSATVAQRTYQVRAARSRYAVALRGRAMDRGAPAGRCRTSRRHPGGHRGTVTGPGPVRHLTAAGADRDRLGTFRLAAADRCGHARLVRLVI